MAERRKKKEYKRPEEKSRVQLGEAITITREQHRDLVEYISDRLHFGNEGRTELVDRFREIDKALAGYLVPSREDRERMKDNRTRGDLKPTDTILQLAMVQLDEELTYLMSVFCPDGTFYSAVAEKDKQAIANAFAALMNKHAEKGQYYREYLKAMLNMLKFDLGGFFTEWREIYGNRISDSGGQAVYEYDVVWQGNFIESIDVYNFIWDRSVPVVKLPMEGEFFGLVSMETKFSLKKLKQQGRIWDLERAINCQQSSVGTSYYEAKPRVRVDITDGTAVSDQTDWFAVLSAGKYKTVGDGYEVVRFYTHIVPKDFGLSTSGDMEIWEFYLINGNEIVGARKMKNAHGMLPCAIGMPLEDDLGIQGKSNAEILLPLQRYGSYLLNVHQRGARRALYGQTFYDSLAFEPNAGSTEEAGFIPVKLSGTDRDIRKHIFQTQFNPGTVSAMQDLQRVYELMQVLLPTNVTQQVANLERATLYQAAATVQGSNRRSHKMAKLIHAQCMTIMNHQLMYNILEFQPLIQILDPQSGQLVDVNPAQFRDTQIEFTISDGLKGIDRLMVVEQLKEIINMLLQRPDITQRVDMMALINHWASLLGERTDLNQFKVSHPLDGLPMDQKNMAYQLLQDAAVRNNQLPAGQQAGAT